MKTTMEGCQSAVIQLTSEQHQGGGLISGLETATMYRATVNCLVLEYNGQEPQTGEHKRSRREAVSDLGEAMESIACERCPVSRMDLVQGVSYLAEAALKKAVILELIEREDLPKNWRP